MLKNRPLPGQKCETVVFTSLQQGAEMQNGNGELLGGMGMKNGEYSAGVGNNEGGVGMSNNGPSAWVGNNAGGEGASNDSPSAGRPKPAGSSWTEEQWRAIACRGENALVTAGAGSGKTRVLVERVLRLVTEGSDPLEIDRLLVVTFTNAAAAEMKQRIGGALEQAIKEKPHFAHLRRQLLLLNKAAISTVHSFCLEVIRKYYYLRDLDPSFRVLDETEAELLRQEIAEEVLEEYYEQQEADSPFYQLVDIYSSDRGDSALQQLIQRLYDFSRSHPDPAAWLQEKAAAFRIIDVAGLEETLWLKEQLLGYSLQLESIAARLLEALQIARKPGGPAPYEKSLEAELHAVELMRETAYSGSWEKLAGALQSPVFGRLAPCRGAAYDTLLKDQAADLRNKCKKDLAGIKKGLLERSLEEQLKELQHLAPLLEILVELVFSFAERYRKVKNEKGTADFSDLEHYALQILRAPAAAPGSMEPSEAAWEYRKKFAGVLVDEYQDINLVQEAILQLVSRPEPGGNLFMVGDVKQSIYRFRMAEPELFLRKMHDYVEKLSPGACIALTHNFRSRKEILAGVNFLFSQIMDEAVGEIAYDNRAWLHYGASYPPAPQLFPQPVQQPAPQPALQPALQTPQQHDQKDLRQSEQQSLQQPVPRTPQFSVQADQQLLLQSDQQPSQQPAGQTLLPSPLHLEQSALQTSQEGVGKNPFDVEAIFISAKATGNGLLGGDETGEVVGAAMLRSGNAGDIADNNEAEAEAEQALDPLLAAEEELEKAALEGRVLAKRIKKLLGEAGSEPFHVLDRETNRQRPVTYRDIVILLRSARNWALPILEELRLAGIPAYAELGTGYFEAVEVEVMLSLLKIIDNPFQEIPLAAVLRSPLVGLKAEQLAQVRAAAPGKNYYDALQHYCAGSGLAENLLRERLQVFLGDLHRWQDQARRGSLAGLIWQVYSDTGYYDLAGGMPGGNQRQANLRALYDRARQYETTSLRGLFRFLRFIERLKERGGDLGAARALGEQENVVRVITVHKSKGLEFPVVFVAGLAKPFNRKDLQQSFLLHKELGFGPKFVDAQLRLIYPTLPWAALKNRLLREMLAEEMRILYVALTRAQEKLILVATVNDLGKEVLRWESASRSRERLLPAHYRSGAGTALDWIGPALLRHPGADALRKWQRDAGQGQCPQKEEKSAWEIQVFTADDILSGGEAALEEGQQRIWGEEVFRLEPVPVNTPWAEEINRRLSWRYSFTAAASHFAKMSVTQLSRLPAAGLTGEDGGVYPWPDPRTDTGVEPRIKADAGTTIGTGEVPRFKMPSFPALRPRFLGRGGLTPAERGTAYHTVMQHLEPDLSLDAEKVTKQLEAMVARELLTEEEKAVIDPGAVAAFFQTPLGQVLCNAAREECGGVIRVEREVPFTMALPAAEVYPDWPAGTANPDGPPGGEKVLIQGVIDCLVWVRDENVNGTENEDRSRTVKENRVEKEGKSKDGNGGGNGDRYRINDSERGGGKYEGGGGEGNVDGVLIIDYKTDNTAGLAVETLKKRYRRQLELYARAVEMLRKVKVKGQYLYFFDRRQVVEL